jgi:hypothetical protein
MRVQMLLFNIGPIVFDISIAIVIFVRRPCRRVMLSLFLAQAYKFGLLLSGVHSAVIRLAKRPHCVHADYSPRHGLLRRRLRHPHPIPRQAPEVSPALTGLSQVADAYAEP